MGSGPLEGDKGATPDPTPGRRRRAEQEQQHRESLDIAAALVRISRLDIVEMIEMARRTDLSFAEQKAIVVNPLVRDPELATAIQNNPTIPKALKKTARRIETWRPWWRRILKRN